MANIGQLQEQSQDGKTYFTGVIRTLDLCLDLKLIPNEDRRSSEAPNYSVIAKSKLGHAVEIGAAWIKETTSLAASAPEFLTITVDDPSMDKPLNVAAFPNKDGIWTIQYRRRQDQQRKSSDEAA